MSLDSLIYVASLYAAVYAVIPRARRLEISLKFDYLDWITLWLGFFAVVYLQFYSSFKIIGLTPHLHLAKWGLTTSNVSFIILLIITVVLYFDVRLKSLYRSNITKFREFIFELSREKKYAELFFLIEKYMDSLEKIYHARFPLSKLQKYFKNNSSEIYCILNFNDTESCKNKVAPSLLREYCKSFKRKLYYLLSKMLPTYEKEKYIAREIIHEILINRNTVRAISMTRPYLALTILKKDFYENLEFIDLYLRYLAEDTKSILYHEIRNNQNLKSGYEYDIPTKNRLLHFFFKDCSVAEKNAVYRPIGEFVINELDIVGSKISTDGYNEPMGDFFEYGQYESKLTMGIRYFDIMVTSALYQNIKLHMCLYYYTYFAKHIIQNIVPKENIANHHEEWPTKYHYALYEMVSCLCKWISCVDHILLTNEYKLLEASKDSNNLIIQKSSMLTLGQVLKYILNSPKVSDDFKQYIMNVVYAKYFELRSIDKAKKYSDMFLDAIRYGGNDYSEFSDPYNNILLDTFEEFDKVPYDIKIIAHTRMILKNDLEGMS